MVVAVVLAIGAACWFIRRCDPERPLRALLGAAMVAGAMQFDPGGSNYRAQSIARNVAITKGMNSIMNALRQRSAANIHREEIKELSESFVAEAAPMVLEVQGETLRLTGTAEAQYESWRKLLREIDAAKRVTVRHIYAGAERRWAAGATIYADTPARHRWNGGNLAGQRSPG